MQADWSDILTLVGRNVAQVKIRGLRVEHRIFESINVALQLVTEVVVLPAQY